MVVRLSLMRYCPLRRRIVRPFESKESLSSGDCKRRVSTRMKAEAFSRNGGMTRAGILPVPHENGPRADFPTRERGNYYFISDG